jgi:LacI family transcriptional regulator
VEREGAVNRISGKSPSNSGESRAAIRDIAERAGVSLATVSRVLNGRPDVSATTRAAVLQVVREAGYVSNRVARASYESAMIALSVPYIRGEYITEVITGAVDALYERGARLLICPAHAFPTQAAPLAERLMQGATDGAVLLSPSESNDELDALFQSGYPFVVIDPLTPMPDRIPVVASANWAGARLAAEHLIALGHTRIGLVTGPAHWTASVDYRAGYQASLVAAGLPLNATLVRVADPSIAGGIDAAEDLLTKARTLSAVIAMNDSIALGVLRAAGERGLGVPADLSIVGCGDFELASIVSPALTTIQQPLQGIGRVAIDVLHRMLNRKPLYATRVELSARLIVRGTTAAPRGTSFLTY